MINVQENFKIDLRTYGRQFNIKLKVNNSDFNADNLNYIKPSFSTPLFKTIMHQIELDSKVFMPKGTKISGRIGVKVNEKNYKYIDLNNYYVQSCERQEDTNSYRVLAYSKMKEAMIDYDLSFEGKTTVRNYLIKICERLGWNTDNIPATFINSGKMIDPNLHTGIKYSFRDALDEIATITCSFLMFKGDNFYLLYLTETNETIDESYLDEDNVTIGEKYFINSLVFSRAEESDNIYRKDNTSITANGLHEYRIADCQLLSTNDRADYIDEMFNYLKTLEFYIFDVQSKGILFLEACDLFNFKLNNTTYKVALLNDEINIDDGLAENLFLDEPEETKTEYKYADSTDKKINQAYILVDKQNKKIIQKVSSVEQSVENITNTQNTATGKNIHLEDSSDEPLVSIKVKGETSQATRSGKNLFNLNNIRNAPSVFTVTETGVNLTNCWVSDVFTFENVLKTFKPNTTYTAKIKAKVVSRPTTLGASQNAVFALYRPASSSLGSAWAHVAYMGDKETIALNTEKEYIQTFKTPADMTDVRFLAYTFYEKQAGAGEIDVSEIMLVEGAYTLETFPEYEKYGASPSPDYPSEIENVEGKNKLDLSKCAFGHCTLNPNGKSITCNIVDYYWSEITTSQLNNYLLKNKGKTLTFSTGTVLSTATSIVIYGTRSDGSTYQEGYESSTGKCSITIADNFTSITSMQFRFNRKSSKYTDTSTIINYVMLEEGTVATDYVPYNSLEIKDTGENLFDCANSKIIYNNGNTSYERLDNGLKLISSGVQYNMIYFLVDTVENLKSKTLTLSSDILFSKEKQYVNFGLYYTDFNSGNRKSFGLIESIKTEGYYTIKGIVEEGENRDYVCIGLRPNMDSNFAKGDYTIYDNLQVEIGETATPYTPYKEQKVTFPLSDGQKLMEGSYLASDGIHHKRKQIVFDGSDDEDWTSYSTKNGLAYMIPILNIKQIILTAIIADLYCDYYTKTSQGKIYDEKIDYGICQRANRPQIIIRNKDILTLAEWKTCLSQNPITVEYELSEEEIVPYIEAQQGAWDKIEQLHTYKNVTNIFSDAELDIVYVRDNGLSDMYETKQNASKNYTKTVEKFAEQKITTDEINQKVAVVNEKLTEYKQNIDSFSFTTENAGGINLIQNSTLENGLDLYHSTTGTVSIEKNIDVKEKTISKSAIKIINGTVITQEINIIPLEDYTFSCLVYKTELTNVTIKIVSDKIEEYQIEAEPETWQKFSANINSSDNSVIIEIICDNNFCYISDRILNKGNAPLGWQRHNGEFKSDNVTINEDGITVTNTNDNMKHVITSSEDKIINTLNGKTEVSFNPDETKMNSTRINEKLTKGKVRETVRDDGTVMVTMDD